VKKISRRRTASRTVGKRWTRLNADLDTNRAEQDETIKTIASLQERLERLKTEEQLLVRMQDALPATTTPPATATPAAADPDQTPVPQPRHENTSDAPKKAARKAPVKKATAKKTATEKTASKKAAAKKAVAKKTEPPLRELLEAILDRHNGEPRTVRDVRDELIATHPDRTTHDQVVRNTLESGVAAGRIDRDRQQGSVMYTLRKTTTDATPATADSTAGEETEKAAAPA
jgi:hypothetical protein